MARAWVGVDVIQRIPGRPRVKAHGWTVARCGQDWKAVARTNRAFGSGKVSVQAMVAAYNDYDCNQGSAKRTVTLK